MLKRAFSSLSQDLTTDIGKPKTPKNPKGAGRKKKRGVKKGTPGALVGGAKTTKTGQLLLKTLGPEAFQVAPKITPFSGSLFKVPINLFNPETGTIVAAEALENLMGTMREWVPVSSTNVDSVAQEGNVVGVKFNSNSKEYGYTFATPEAATEAREALSSSGSPGRWVWENLRGHVKGEKVGATKLGPAITSGEPTIGGTSASLVKYTLGKPLNVTKIKNFSEIAKQLSRTKSPYRDPSTSVGAMLEGKLGVRKGFRELGMKIKQDLEEIKEITTDMKLNFNPAELRLLLSMMEDVDREDPMYNAILRNMATKIENVSTGKFGEVEGIAMSERARRDPNLVNTIDHMVNTLIDLGNQESDKWAVSVMEEAELISDWGDLAEFFIDTVGDIAYKEDDWIEGVLESFEKVIEKGAKPKEVLNFIEETVSLMHQESEEWMEGVREGFNDIRGNLKKGRGWHGEPERHSKAAKKGKKDLYDLYDIEYLGNVRDTLRVSGQKLGDKRKTGAGVFKGPRGHNEAELICPKCAGTIRGLGRGMFECKNCGLEGELEAFRPIEEKREEIELEQTEKRKRKTSNIAISSSLGQGRGWFGEPERHAKAAKTGKADMEEGRWITVRGTHIFIPKGKSVKEVVNKKFKKQQLKEKVAKKVEKTGVSHEKAKKQVLLKEAKEGAGKKSIFTKVSALTKAKKEKEAKEKATKEEPPKTKEKVKIKKKEKSKEVTKNLKKELSISKESLTNLEKQAKKLKSKKLESRILKLISSVASGRAKSMISNYRSKISKEVNINESERRKALRIIKSIEGKLAGRKDLIRLYPKITVISKLYPQITTITEDIIYKDFMPLSSFTKLTEDSLNQSFVVFKGGGVRDGGYDYNINGVMKTLYKDWGNIKDLYGKYDYLPLRATEELGAHYAEELGFVYNFTPDESKHVMDFDVVLLHPERFEGLLDESKNYHISPGYHDEIIGDRQIMLDLDHVALSLGDEMARACTRENEFGASCTTVKIVEVNS